MKPSYNRPNLLVVLALALALSPSLVLAAPAFAAPSAPATAAEVTAGGQSVIHFEWHASAANVSGDAAFIDSSATNGRPGDVLFVTPNPYGGATCPCFAIPSLPPIGVQYHSGRHEWAVVTEDKSAMPADESFNVLAEPAAGGSVLVQKATPSNTRGGHTLINSPLTNGKPGAVIEATAVVNPGGKKPGVFDPHPVGVRYYATQHKWAVFNEDGKKMPAGASFNLLIGSAGSGGGNSKVIKATAANEKGEVLLFSNSVSNSRPGSMTFATPDWNPGGQGGTSVQAEAGVIYDTPNLRWAVFGEKQSSAPPLGAAYNLLSYPGNQEPVTDFEFTANASETSGDQAAIESDVTHGRPGDLLFVTPNPYRGASCPCIAIADLPAIGVKYSDGDWTVVTETQTAMPASESFNVLAVPFAGAAAFVFRAAKANIKGSRALINSSLLNGKPGAVIQVTAVVNPGGKGAGVFDPHPVGVRYYPAQHKWAVFNEDGKKMPLGAAFNILAGTSASGGGTSKVLTATASGEVGRLALFSSAESNGRPGSVSFVTPDFNPGGKGGTLTADPPGVFYYPTDSRWAVFEEGKAAPPSVGASYNLLIYPGS